MYGLMSKRGDTIIEKKWKKKLKKGDKRRLRSVKPSIDNEEPGSAKVQMHSARFNHEKELHDKIDRENKVLLSKMTDIIVKPTPLYENKGPSFRSSSSINTKSSLNAESRRRDLERITKENYKLLKRLQSKKSNFNAKKWEHERQQ